LDAESDTTLDMRCNMITERIGKNSKVSWMLYMAGVSCEVFCLCRQSCIRVCCSSWNV